MSYIDFGPGDEETWGPYLGHENDPRSPDDDDNEDFSTEDMIVLGRDLICHPLSMGISEIEKAGEIIIDAVEEIEMLRKEIEQLRTAVSNGR